MDIGRRILGYVFPFRVRRRGVDTAFYYRHYPDVAESGLAAETHYRTHGWREGRNPAADFHSAYYAVRHLPNGRLSEDPLAHFMARGGDLSGLDTFPEVADDWIALQMRVVADHFDDAFYRRHYGTLLGGLAPIDHYFAIGWRIGCNPSGDFDSQAYLDRHAYVSQSDLNPLFHFVLSTDGRPEIVADEPTTAEPQRGSVASDSTARPQWAAEPSTRELPRDRWHSIGRADLLSAIGADFDADFYKTAYKDVAKAGLDPLIHFVDHGWREGRNPSALFDTRYYQASYGGEFGPDVNPLYHYVTIGRERGYRTSPIGSGHWPRPTAPSDADWARVAAASDPDAEVDVIIPVYRGYDDTLATIHSVLAHPQKTRFHLTVINDFGPEPKLTEKLRELARRSLFTYLENEENLGFIGTVNKGLDLRPDLDVILLNADTLVFGGWIDRLLAHARADARIGTITPYSNNATICSYPETNHANTIALECTLAQLDAYAGRCNEGRRTPVPTGVGFCFYIRRSVISEIGRFDPAFGRGYGEENDFCMRVLKAGYTNVLAEDVLVFHSGGVSFSEFFAEEYGAGQRLLIGKHPDYARRVAEYVHADPGRPGRARLDLYRLARAMGDRVALLVTMNAGGGVVVHVDAMARRLEAAGITVLFAQVTGDSVTFRPFDRQRDLYTPSLKSIDLSFDADLFAEFLDWLQPSLIHLHSLALASWRASEVTMRLCGHHRDRLYVTLHDYDPLCFRHNLVDAEGRYCERPERRKCISCARATGAPNRCDPDVRTAGWRAFLGQARRVFVPSTDTRDRLAETFPDIAFAVREHEEELDGVAALPPPDRDEPLRLVGLGAIGPHKGSNLIYSLALDAQNRKLPIEYHIVGYTAIDSDLKKIGVSISGRYFSTRECIEQMKVARPSFALLPSIWPETYCYTLSIALALGVPPIVFDLGAQADRARAAGFGVVLDSKLLCDPGAINDAILRLSVADEWAKARPVAFRRYDRFPYDYYDLTTGEAENDG